jgi:hypothetical protein
MLKLNQLIGDLQKLQAAHGDIPVLLDIKKFPDYTEIDSLGLAKDPDFGTPFALISDNPLRQRDKCILIPSIH